MRRVLAEVGRATAFVRKEVIEVLRQPRLVITLIVGPFAILALFGIGYQRETGPLRAVLVIEEQNAELTRELETRLADLGDSIILEKTTDDVDEARRLVRLALADVAVVAPPDPYETVRNGEQAVFELLHDTLDPFEQATIRLVARATIDAVNRELLTEIVATGQDESAEVEPLLQASQESASLMRTALEAGDTASARAQRSRLGNDIDQLRSLVGPTNTLSRTLGSQLGDDGETSDLATKVDELDQRVGELEIEEPLTDDVAQMESVEADLEELRTALTDFRRVEPAVLVSPLDVDTSLIGSVGVDLTDFYAPGVIALLLQHLAITFASLSLVRERALGTTEVFRVAPLGSSHILIGKYIGYTLGASVVAAALSLLMLTVFGVPVVGSLVDYAVIQLLLTLASLGLGFLISMVVTSDTQAVNMAMIVLLLSIFFSGFFLSLDRLLPAVRVVSWLLPITHALDSMRDVMFRGIGIDLRTWLALGVGSIGLYVAAWLLLRRQLRSA